MPMLLSMPLTQKESFTEMGRPWRGPSGEPVRARWASRYSARERAEEKRGSVRQAVSWWDIVARWKTSENCLREWEKETKDVRLGKDVEITLQNAVVTSTAVNLL